MQVGLLWIEVFRLLSLKISFEFSNAVIGLNV